MDTQYEDLLFEVLKGTYKPDRTGVGTKSLFGATLRYDLGKGFPLITTKKVWFRGIVGELLWFLRGETNIRSLQADGIHIWDEWADENGDLGPVYGSQWRAWPTPDGTHIDQMADVLKSLRTNPNSRRHIVSAWNVAEVDKTALPPCHMLFQFYVADGRLSCQLYQRSADLFLGVPFNIASYALLTHMMARHTGLIPGDFIWVGGDVHIYMNHLDQVTEQLSRQPYAFPRLEITGGTSLFTHKLDDFSVVGYNCHPAIKAEVAV